jgi:hypothetical protein
VEFSDFPIGSNDLLVKCIHNKRSCSKTEHGQSTIREYVVVGGGGVKHVPGREPQCLLKQLPFFVVF